MLHGELKVNGTIVGHWTARRLKPLSLGQDIYSYEYEVTQTRWDGTFVTTQGRVRHRYAEGAAMLAGKVLKAAGEMDREHLWWQNRG